MGRPFLGLSVVGVATGIALKHLPFRSVRSVMPRHDLNRGTVYLTLGRGGAIGLAPSRWPHPLRLNESS